jgi:phosphonate transport system permease protein
MKHTEFRDEDQMKVKLFDRIFKPQVITLDNGNTVERPRSRMPLILIALFIVIFWALRMTGFDLSVITS